MERHFWHKLPNGYTRKQLVSATPNYSLISYVYRRETYVDKRWALRPSKGGATVKAFFGASEGALRSSCILAPHPAGRRVRLGAGAHGHDGSKSRRSCGEGCRKGPRPALQPPSRSVSGNITSISLKYAFASATVATERCRRLACRNIMRTELGLVVFNGSFVHAR